MDITTRISRVEVNANANVAASAISLDDVSTSNLQMSHCISYMTYHTPPAVYYHNNLIMLTAFKQYLYDSRTQPVPILKEEEKSDEDDDVPAWKKQKI